MKEDLRAKLLAGLKGNTTLSFSAAKVQSVPKPASVKEQKRATTQKSNKLPSRVSFNNVPLNDITRRDLAADTTPLWEFHQEGGAKPLNQGGIEREMQSRAVPSKRAIKTTMKLSHQTRSQFGRAALKGVPGSSHIRPFANVAMMYDERTGTLVVDDSDDSNDEVKALRRRLERSARNCNTTAAHYIVEQPTQHAAKSMLSIMK